MIFDGYYSVFDCVEFRWVKRIFHNQELTYIRTSTNGKVQMFVDKDSEREYFFSTDEIEPIQKELGLSL